MAAAAAAILDDQAVGFGSMSSTDIYPDYCTVILSPVSSLLQTTTPTVALLLQYSSHTSSHRVIHKVVIQYHTVQPTTSNLETLGRRCLPRAPYYYWRRFGAKDLQYSTSVYQLGQSIVVDKLPTKHRVFHERKTRTQ